MGQSETLSFFRVKILLKSILEKTKISFDLPPVSYSPTLPYEPCLNDEERYNFFLADCDSIIQDLRSIEWTGLFSCKKVDQCVDIFYDVVENILNKNVPQSRSKRNLKLPWHSNNVHVLKNRSNLAAKKLKQSKIRCLTNPLIDECACENLRGEFVAARSELQFVSKKNYNAYCENVEKSIKSDPKAFFKFVDLNRTRCGFHTITTDQQHF
jgi:hypothetical protein